VHGWVPDGNPPIAPNLEGWQGSGFNTVFMRWHHAATDSAAGCPGGGGIFGIPNVPCNAEARVFGQRGSLPHNAGERFVEGYKQLFQAHPNAGEVRVVAHSLGSQMAAYLTYRLYHEGWNGRRPTRIDLLDPFASPANPGTPFPSYIIPNDQAVGGGSCGSGNRGTGYCRLENMLQFLRDRGVGTLVIRGPASSHFTNDLHYVSPVVEMPGDWVGGDLKNRHAAVVPWYMCQVGWVGTATPFCASNPMDFQPYVARGAASVLSRNDALVHGSVFNWRYYRDTQSDLSWMSPNQLVDHWRNHGARECRRAHPEFDVQFYRRNNGDLSSFSCDEATRHFVNHGLGEGRLNREPGAAYQSVLGPRTSSWVLARLGGTSSTGLPLIQKFLDHRGRSTVSAHDDVFKY
ncbi:MAG: hypothetical protein MUE69_22850, partial [Myxococcota bacterium]|nr:hypothetical protein [Myxococcota bacterium]